MGAHLSTKVCLKNAGAPGLMGRSGAGRANSPTLPPNIR